MGYDAYIFPAVLAVALALGLLRGFQRRRATLRRETARQAYQDHLKAERNERRDIKARLLVGHYFPHIKDDVLGHVASGQALKGALRRAINEVPGVTLGVSEFGVDLRLPEDLRTRHVQIWGRSGGGKTVCMTHMLLDDLKRPEKGAVAVVCPEPELHDEILGRAETRDVIYLAVGDPRCRVAFNPFRREANDPIDRHAAALFSALKSCLGESRIGPRSDPLLANSISLALHAPAGTLLTVRLLLTDTEFRNLLLDRVNDAYLKQYWEEIGSKIETIARPVLSRLDAYLRNPSIRKALTHDTGSFTMREVVESQKVLLVDTSGLGNDDAALITSLVVTLLRLELFRREAALSGSPPPVRLYIDEWASVVNTGNIEEFSTLLMRSRKYNCSLVLAGQFPSQVAVAVRQQVAGNVSNCVVLGLGARDAASIRHELLRPGEKGQLKPVDAGEIVQSPIGVGFARIGAACAIKTRFKAPEPSPPMEVVERFRERSWTKYAAPAVEPERLPVASAPPDALLQETREAEPERASTRSPATGADTSPPPGPFVPRPVPPASRETPQRAPGLPVPRPPALPTEGRGGRDHKYLQALIKKLGHSRGYKATIEKRVKGGSVDVALERTGTKVAVEVCVTSSVTQELGHVATCLSAGFEHVVVVSQNQRNLQKIEKGLAKGPGKIDTKDRDRVHCLTPDALIGFLDQLDATAASSESTVHGYKVRVQYQSTDEDQAMAKQHAISKVVAATLKKSRG